LVDSATSNATRFVAGRRIADGTDPLPEN